MNSIIHGRRHNFQSGGGFVISAHCEFFYPIISRTLKYASKSAICCYNISGLQLRMTLCLDWWQPNNYYDLSSTIFAMPIYTEPENLGGGFSPQSPPGVYTHVIKSIGGGAYITGHQLMMLSRFDHDWFHSPGGDCTLYIHHQLHYICVIIT